jgi:hypothetical protein
LEPQYARKVLKRVLDDRGVQFGTARSQGRPDDATVWLYGALADPEGWILHAPAHTIALPPSDTRTHLPPSRHRPGLDGVHPLAAAPPLFGRVVGDKFALITTLQLDSAVDNASVMALRYAPHLTVLWTRRCHGLSDDGVRMLAASLVPPLGSADAQGLWRLRAWYLAGCKQVGDGSMKSFARWPGLVLLGEGQG